MRGVVRELSTNLAGTPLRHLWENVQGMLRNNCRMIVKFLKVYLLIVNSQSIIMDCV